MILIELSNQPLLKHIFCGNIVLRHMDTYMELLIFDKHMYT